MLNRRKDPLRQEKPEPPIYAQVIDTCRKLITSENVKHLEQDNKYTLRLRLLRSQGVIV